MHAKYLRVSKNYITKQVHSAWYDRRTLQHTYKFTLHRKGVKRIGLKQIADNTDTVQLDYASHVDKNWKEKGHHESLDGSKKTYSTGYSQAVTHPSTNPTQCCLTSVIRREPVHSAWYGRRTLQHTHKHLLYRNSVKRIGLLQIADNTDTVQLDYASHVH